MAYRITFQHFLFFGLFSLLFNPCVASAKTDYDYVRVPLQKLSRHWVEKNQFIRDHKWDDQFAFGYLPKGIRTQTWDALRDELVFLDAWEWARQDHDAKTLLPVATSPSKISGREPFHTYETLTKELKELANQYPNLVRLESAGKTVEGRDLWLLRVSSPVTLQGPKPKLLYVSSMHGDEVTGKEMMVYLLRDLTSKYGKDLRISSLLDRAEIFIMPSMNPDGTARHQRFNANGVDLNRDFPELNEDPFGGNRAPETRALMELHRKHTFALAMNFHGGSLCVNIPWDSKPNGPSAKFGDDAAMMELAKNYVSTNIPMSKVSGGSFYNGVTYGYEWYEVLGGMQDWASHFRQAIHATLEVSSAKWPSDASLAGFWQDNRESLLAYLEGGLMGIHLKVVDKTGTPIKVSIDVDTASRSLNYEGYVHRITTQGVQQVTLKSPGHKDLSLKWNATAFDGTYTQLQMESQR